MTLLLLFGGAGVPAPPADGIPGFSVEIAFGYTWQDADPSWTDVSEYVLDSPGFDIDRGRSRELDSFQTGSASFTLINDDRRFDPFYEDGPYYGDLKPNVPVRIRVEWGLTYTTFRGFVDGWPQTYTPANVTAYVPINCSDAFKLVSALALTSASFIFDDEEHGFDVGRFGGAGIEDEQTSGERIASLLDLAGWPAGLRDIATGATTVQAQDTTGSALEAMQLVEKSEDGFLYVEADGTITFVDRFGRVDLTRMNTSQATFSDADDTSPYDDLTYPYDDQLIYNDVRRTREGGVEQSAEDATSISSYFRKPHSESGLVMSTDAQARALAVIFLERYKEPQQRVDGLTINPDNAPIEQWPLVLGLRILDRITVVRTPQEIGDPISQDYWVQGMRHSWRSMAWRTTYYLTPVDEFEFFTFDDLALGLFDTGGVFAP